MQAPHRKVLGDKNSQFFKTPMRAALKPVNNAPGLSVHRSTQQLMPAKPASQQVSTYCLHQGFYKVLKNLEFENWNLRP